LGRGRRSGYGGNHSSYEFKNMEITCFNNIKSSKL
jgi:hypothetical protein